MDTTRSEALRALVEMGFDERLSLRALESSDGTVEAAMTWLLDGGNATDNSNDRVVEGMISTAECESTEVRGEAALDGEEDDDEDDEDEDEEDYEMNFEPLKMVMVVRTDLGMSAGKIAAQCVHAALGAYRIAQEKQPSLLQIWEETGEKAVCLRAKSEAELDALQAAAIQIGLINYVVVDAGRTQISEGSKTVLALGPAPEDEINAISGALKLY